MAKIETEYFGRKLSIECGAMARQANGSALVRYGDTVVLVTATASSEPKEGSPFLPLTVDFQEKFYSAGRIPGGFIKREGRPSQKATLTARLIDRPLRPSFPEGYVNETHIVVTVLSYDQSNDPDILAILGASAALEVSDIPFRGPVAGVRVGRIGGKLVINPISEELKKSDMDIFVVGNSHAILMVEGGAQGLAEEEILAAILFGHKEMKPLLAMQEKLKKEMNAPKMAYISAEMPKAELAAEVSKFAEKKILDALRLTNKKQRNEARHRVMEEVLEKFTSQAAEADKKKLETQLEYLMEELEHKVARHYTLTQGKRIDGRKYDEIRSITSQVSLLPRTHGSALFTRGETQALCTVTLGTTEDQQRIDSIEGEASQRFMLHYNFPPFSVGEAGFLRAPGRREIGHGALAEKALSAILPPEEGFPYTIRLVSEILESNGSSSMATVCSGTLALMDCGVPIKTPVAGIAMGLIKEGDKIAILSDILGDEDGFGDMDFKVAGTPTGVTAIQMDIKIEGVSEQILTQALHQAKEGRLFILQKMKQSLERPRSELSAHAPRIHTITIKPEKIKDVIGPAGRIIKDIIEKTGVKIDIQDNSGRIHIASTNQESAEKAIQMIRALTEEAQINKLYMGKVKRIVDFGAFVEILPGVDGLVHISELEFNRVQKVTDVLHEGDEVLVKVLDIDRQGKIRLSRKAALGKKLEDDQPSAENSME